MAPLIKVFLHKCQAGSGHTPVTPAPQEGNKRIPARLLATSLASVEEFQAKERLCLKQTVERTGALTLEAVL